MNAYHHQTHIIIKRSPFIRFAASHFFSCFPCIYNGLTYLLPTKAGILTYYDRLQRASLIPANGEDPSLITSVLYVMPGQTSTYYLDGALFPIAADGLTPLLS